MIVEPPKIDERNYEILVEEMKTLIPAFLPKWKPTEKEDDSGLAMIKIYSHMAEEVIHRLNRVPQKHFAAFLDMMGISLLPASAARAPVTFCLSEGADQHVLIPKGTSVAAGEKNVVFETEADIWATPAKLMKVIPDDALYLGFDRQIQKGPIGIYFSLNERENLEKEIPKVSWYYSQGQENNPWKILEVKDHTRNLTESGIIEFFMPVDFDKKNVFQEELYWIRAVGIPAEEMEKVKIEHTHINTCFVAQVETIHDEILGSSDGGADQEFQLQRIPVVSEEIWVDETRTLPGEEKHTILVENGEDAVRENTDETGKTINIHVRWQPVDDFFDSSPGSRHYTLQRADGRIRFGDGIHGKIPPIGTDNINASYRVGGGRKGNVGAFEISDVRTSIPYIDSIANPEPAEGGGDTEQIAGVFTRGPYLIKHRNRAVTPEDFERIASSVSAKIARTRCVVKNDRLTIIVIPYGKEEKPIPSPALLKLVKRHIVKYGLNTLSPDRIVVQKPQYVDVSIFVDIFPASMETVVLLESGILKALNQFLHPLFGGPEGKGWDFGRDLHISDVYALLESMEGVDHAANLRLNGKEEDVVVNEYQTLCPGMHRIDMKVRR